MKTNEKKYALRYSVEPWGKTVPETTAGTLVAEGVMVSDDDYGYTDSLLLASIVKDEKGNASILILDNEAGEPTLETLCLLRRHITMMIDKIRPD